MPPSDDVNIKLPSLEIYKSIYSKLEYEVVKLSERYEPKKNFESILDLMDSFLHIETVSLFEFSEARFLLEFFHAVVKVLLSDLEKAGQKVTTTSSGSQGSGCFSVKKSTSKLQTNPIQKSLGNIDRLISEFLVEVPSTKNKFFLDAPKWYLRYNLSELVNKGVFSEPRGDDSISVGEEVMNELRLTGILPTLRVENNLLNTAIRRDLYPNREVGSIMGPAEALYSSSSVEFVRAMYTKIADGRGKLNVIRAQASYIQNEFLKEDAENPLNYEGSNHHDSNPFFNPDLLEPFTFDEKHPLAIGFAFRRKLAEKEKRSSLLLFTRGSSPSVSLEDMKSLKFVISEAALPRWLQIIGPLYQEMEKFAYNSVITQQTLGHVPTYNTIVKDVIERKEQQLKSLSSRASFLGVGEHS